MASETVSFHNVNRDAFEAVVSRLEHFDVTQEDDVLHALGVRGHLSYDDESSSVTVEIHQVPRIVSRGYVVGWLCDALIEAAG